MHSYSPGRVLNFLRLPGSYYNRPVSQAWLKRGFKNLACTGIACKYLNWAVWTLGHMLCSPCNNLVSSCGGDLLLLAQRGTALKWVHFYSGYKQVKKSQQQALCLDFKENTTLRQNNKTSLLAILYKFLLRMPGLDHNYTVYPSLAVNF